MPPEILRDLIRQTILSHIDEDRVDDILKQQRRDQETMRSIVEHIEIIPDIIRELERHKQQASKPKRRPK